MHGRKIVDQTHNWSHTSYDRHRPRTRRQRDIPGMVEVQARARPQERRERIGPFDDLRRVFSTRVAEYAQPHVLERILNPSAGQISGVARIYNQFKYTAEMREALQKWELRLLTILRHRPKRGGGPLSDMTLCAVLRRMKVHAVPHDFRSMYRDCANERAPPKWLWRTPSVTRWRPPIDVVTYSRSGAG